MNKVDKNARAGVAAMANIPQVMQLSQVAFRVGHYRGESAMAIGASGSSADGRWVVKGSASIDTRSHSSIGAGVSYLW